MLTNTQHNNVLMEKAHRVLPGGTFGNTPADVIIREGRGSRVWDEDGNEYVDFLMGSGPMLIGHGHPDVKAAVSAQLERGTTFFANNRQGIDLAEAIVEAMPGGLSDFFRAIGRPRESGAAAPAPFARPDNVAEIEARTVFAKRPAVSQVS